MPTAVVPSCHPPPKVCAPLWSQECGTSVFSSGRCLRLDGQLQLVGTIAPTAQREWGGAYWDILGCATPGVTVSPARLFYLYGHHPCSGRLQQHLPLGGGAGVPREHPGTLLHRSWADPGQGVAPWPPRSPRGWDGVPRVSWLTPGQCCCSWGDASLGVMSLSPG